MPKNKQAEEGQFEVVPVTSRTTRLFLGLQTQCVQCHDHPFNPDWKQNNFWGVNVFFRQVHREGQPNMMRANRDMSSAAVLTLRDDSNANRDGIVYYEKRNGEIRPALTVFLDGRIGFTSIPVVIDRTMDAHRPAEVTTLAQVRAVNDWAREYALEMARGVELKV